MRNKLVSLLLLVSFLLTGCVSRYESVQAHMDSCGFPSEKYAVFHDCMKKHVKSGKGDDPNDYYSKSTKELFYEMQQYRELVSAKKTTDLKAMLGLRGWVDDQALKEKESSEKVAIAAGILLLGAGAAACANNGGCGGQSFASSNNQGCCSWHNGVSGMCRSGRVVCNDGQLSPSCRC